VAHWDPVYELAWLQSKTQSECVTVSTDARCIFWDVRQLKEPLDECELTDGSKEEPRRLGGVALEWMQEAGPTKFLVGTEEGTVLLLNKKPKKDVEIGTWFGQPSKGGDGAHFGPAYSVRRNPQHPKAFLTVGDWRAQLWLEELKAPLLNTVYHEAYLSAGAWSPTRAGVFCVARTDGWLDFWDYYYRMNQVSLSHRVTDGDALTTVAPEHSGRFVAVGDCTGTMTLLELCDGLVQPGPNEKNVIGQLIDREMKREKNLDLARKAAGNRKAGDDRAARPSGPSDELLEQRREAFLDQMGLRE